MAGHVGNPSTKFQDPSPIRSWLMSYDVRHRPPLTTRLEPLRMRRITWPVRRGQIFPKYLKSLTPICLFTMQPPRLYDQDKLSYCQNSVRPCVKGERDVCACAKSRELYVGVENNYIFGISDPVMLIHYTTFMELRWRLRVVYLVNVHVKGVFERKFLSPTLTLTFDLLPSDSGQTWQVTWATPSTKFEDPTL